MLWPQAQIEVNQQRFSFCVPGHDERLFQIDRGDKMRIGRINISGNDPTLDKVVRREILINEGDVYGESLIKAGKARLQRLGYFEEVNMSTPRGDG